MIDLTDDSLLQNLPSFPPSSAELHLLAASVVNPASSDVNHTPKPALSSAPNNTEHFTENLIGEIPGTLFIYMNKITTNKSLLGKGFPNIFVLKMT